eukprot:bmy_07940T0
MGNVVLRSLAHTARGSESPSAAARPAHAQFSSPGVSLFRVLRRKSWSVQVCARSGSGCCLSQSCGLGSCSFASSNLYPAQNDQSLANITTSRRPPHDGERSGPSFRKDSCTYSLLCTFSKGTAKEQVPVGTEGREPKHDSVVVS